MTIASDSGSGVGRTVAAQALVAADDVAPLHQAHPRVGVDLDDRRADQVAAVDLAAGADLDLGGDLVRVAAASSSSSRTAGRSPTSSGASGTRPTPAALASTSRAGDVAVGGEAVGRGVALEAVDEPALAAAADRERGCAAARRSSIRPSSGTITAAIPGRSGSGPTPARSSRRSSGAAGEQDGAEEDQVQLAHGVAGRRRRAPCFGVTLKAVWPGRTTQRSARV